MPSPRRNLPPNPFYGSIRRGGIYPSRRKASLVKGRWTPKAARGILTGLALHAVAPAAGRESLRLAYARHLPLTREASAVTPAAGRESLRLAYARHLPLTREASAVTPAAGQESLRLAYARHLPLTREAFRQSVPTTSERRLPCPRHQSFLHNKRSRLWKK